MHFMKKISTSTKQQSPDVKETPYNEPKVNIEDTSFEHKIEQLRAQGFPRGR